MRRIDAISTFYKGIIFRSKLEAQWAVFFDEIGVDYIYEPFVFPVLNVFGKDEIYIPDFYFPKYNHFGEVKYGWDDDSLNKKMQKYELFSRQIKCDLVFFIGSPNRKPTHSTNYPESEYVDMIPFRDLFDDDGTNYYVCCDGMESVNEDAKHSILRATNYNFDIHRTLWEEKPKRKLSMDLLRDLDDEVYRQSIDELNQCIDCAIDNLKRITTIDAMVNFNSHVYMPIQKRISIINSGSESH